ncbi:hypothetical protein [Labrenzia sp. PHM005]|uniref:hypothetical protein n=1 Tax=Labrenzia sp. PHM005 TaxID=2590016 RepID=UPI0011403A54|nr:hypothetical protein [Labrenzia sp. PHM005]QDG74947.1 hypothetical protein FJ695_03180 [Labrenzia sp. PHM005]
MDLTQAQVTPVPQVGTTVDGTLVVSAPDTATAFPDGDWTNQELADLYRVESLLIQAGIKMSTGRGVTDENDPWFVFCREDGDVFVHLARADGRYLLDSPGLSGLLEGPDFTTLIDRFVEQLAALRQPEDTGNVVSFRPKMLKDNTVYLHPSVLLAALIWTLYLASDDIASATEAAGDMAEDMILPVDQLLKFDQAGDSQLPDAESAPFGSGADNQNTKAGQNSQSDTASGAAYPDSDRAAPGSDRLVAGFGAMAATASPAAQAVSASLAIIAFSYGFYGSQAGKDSDATSGNEFSIAGLHFALRELAESVSASSRHVADQIPGDIQTGFDATPVVLESLEGASPVEVADVVDFQLHLADLAADTVTSDLTALEAPIDEPRARTTEAENAGHAAEPDGVSEETTAVSDDNETASAEPTQQDPAVTAQPAATPVETDITSDSVTTAALDKLSSGSSYTVGVAAVSTTMNQDDFDTFTGFLQTWRSDTDPNGLDDDAAGTDGDLAAVSDLLPGLSDPQTDGPAAPAPAEPAPGLGTPDPSAPETPRLSAVNAEIEELDIRVDLFLSNVMHIIDTVEIVFFNSGSATELVFYDKSAVDDATDRPHARSWVNEDGMVVSMVGHYQDFVAYGLV